MLVCMALDTNICDKGKNHIHCFSEVAIVQQ